MTWLIVAWSVVIACSIGILYLRKIANAKDYDNRNKKVGQRVMWILLCVVTVLFLIVGVLQLNPLRRSPASIRANVLRSTPIGMTRENVERIVTESNYTTLISRLSTHNIDIEDDSHLYSWDFERERGDGLPMRRVMGRTLTYHVIVLWMFCTDGRLLDVSVFRTLAL